MSLISSCFAVLFLVSFAEIFSRFRLWRMNARTLRMEQAPAFFAMVAEEARLLGLARYNKAPKVWYVPAAQQATAFTFGGFSPKLVVTGRLIVAAAAAPTSASVVLRHEMSHIANKDQRMWLVLVSTAIGVIPGAL